MTKNTLTYTLALCLSLTLTGCSILEPSAEHLYVEESSETDSDAQQKSESETDSEPPRNLLGKIADRLDRGEDTEVRPEQDYTQDSEPDVWDEFSTAPLTTIYTLTVDETGLVNRTQGPLDWESLNWVITFNGSTMLERAASGELSYRPLNYGPGEYSVWLESYLDGCYQQVSNTVTFPSPYERSAAEPPARDGDFDPADVLECKEALKHLIREYDGLQYRMGFVIDPDNDGQCNDVAFYAGSTVEGKADQILFDNDEYGIYFDKDYVGLDYEDYEYGIWFDQEGGRDYIVFVSPDGDALDAMTNAPIGWFEKNENYFTFDGDSTPDYDHFYVSHQGKPVKENA